MKNIIIFEKKNNNITIQDYDGADSRNKSTIKHLILALREIDKDIEQRVIYTDDVPIKNILGLKTYCYSTVDEDYSLTCPDFLFDCWREVNIDDYEAECNKINIIGKNSYLLNKIGWIGSITGNKRAQLFAYDNFFLKRQQKEFLDIRQTVFNRDLKGICSCDNFMTLEQQIKQWKYLLDIEGNGWSARMKLLMWSGRPIFLVERPYKEFFFQYLEPWKHFIPVKNDFSDLENNYNIIEKDYELYNYISKESLMFANKYLTRTYAIKYWKQILED